MTRVLPVLLAAALVAAAPSAAKEGVLATLETPIPLDAPPGEALALEWTLAAVGEKGTTVPFRASGVYVVFLSAAGAAPTTGLAFGDGGSRGRYAATIAVPEGGIGGIQVALMGWANGEPSPVAFPIANDPLPPVALAPPVPGPAEAPVPDPAPAERAGGFPLLSSGIAAGVVLALAAAAALLLRRRRPASA
jgi:hypothetical protein